MRHPLEILIIDARNTAGRMVDDARHLRELGRRAKVGAKLAKAQIRAKVEGGLEAVADHILAFEERLRGRP